MEEYPKEAIFAGQSRAASADAGAAISKSREVRLPIKTLIGYRTSMIGLNGMATMISVYLLFFYTHYTHLVLVASTRVGLVGYLSDHTSWKWGRRRPIPSILIVIGILIFLKFPITKDMHRDILRQIAEQQKGADQ